MFEKFEETNGSFLVRDINKYFNKETWDKKHILASTTKFIKDTIKFLIQFDNQLSKYATHFCSKKKKNTEII